MKKLLITFLGCFSILFQSCKDSDLSGDIDDLRDRIINIEAKVSEINQGIIDLRTVLDGKVVIVGIEDILDGAEKKIGYVLKLSDGNEIEVTLGDQITDLSVGINADGYWIYEINGDGIERPYLNSQDEPISAKPEDGITPEMKVDGDGYWIYSYDGTVWLHLEDDHGHKVPAPSDKVTFSNFFTDVEWNDDDKTITLTTKAGEQTVTLDVVDDFDIIIKKLTDPHLFTIGETIEFVIEQVGIKEVSIIAPGSWSVQLTDELLTIKSPSTFQPNSSSTESALHQIEIFMVSSQGYLKRKIIAVNFINVLLNTEYCDTWNEFQISSANNVLLDFSYAGYKHGESAPPEVTTPKYKIFDVTEYGANGADGNLVSDRDAFKAAIAAATTHNNKNTSNSSVVYFPDGKYILHDKNDDVDGVSGSIFIHTSNIVIKGESRDGTILEMVDPNLPDKPEPGEEIILYSSPVLLNIKHNRGFEDLTTVTGSAAQGAFSLDVASTAGISVGDWVCLYLLNNDNQLIAEELYPHTVLSTMTNLLKKGVEVNDIHQVKSKTSTSLTFKEPIMRAVDPKWGWKIKKFHHYENVGIEDLTFLGHAKDNFGHHDSWQDDGAYKPLTLMRLVNSWMRRVTFKDVSEACSIASSANVSVYDVLITGKRGHSAIRSQGSSRVFMGKITDDTDGTLVDGGEADGVGQYHACGVSKPSMGAVLWNLEWGTDSNFEAHSSQPRATLIDNCYGGFMRNRMGGAEDQLPNHHNDLVLWNFNATTTNYTKYGSEFMWWDAGTSGWKTLPPVVVGFHGVPVNFDESSDQIRRLESNGTRVFPESLYEAQLKKRLTFVPQWLLNLK